MTTLNYSMLFHFAFAVEFKFMSHLNDSTMKRRILFSVMCAVIAASVFAQGQGQGLAGINAATSLMTSYFDLATKLCYAIGAVLGLVGLRWCSLRWHPLSGGCGPMDMHPLREHIRRPTGMGDFSVKRPLR